MKAGVLLILWMSFFILCPVLEIEGHFVYLPEAFLYLSFCAGAVSSFLRRRNPPELKKKPPSGYHVHILYGILFFFTSALTAVLVEEFLNNYDIYIIRNIIQIILCLKLLDEIIGQIENKNQLNIIVFVILSILCIPSLLVYIQRIDLFSLRDVIISLYKTHFSYLGANYYKSFRYASVFKDFFTSAVYFTMLASFIFYFSLRTCLSVPFRVILILLLAFVYGAQFFVARTSLVLIPLFVCGIGTLGVPWNISFLLKRVLPALLLIVGAGILASVAVIETGLVKMDWAMEAHSFVASTGKEKSSSLLVLQEWYQNYFDTLYRKTTTRRDYSLLVPYHSYDITERSSVWGLYSDSFYLQEIYRYGIYAIIAYSTYIILIVKEYIVISRYVVLLILVLAVLNIKGGNTFFMSKNIYLYAFILTVVPYIENRRP